jgi:hypothetical protein
MRVRIYQRINIRSLDSIGHDRMDELFSQFQERPASPFIVMRRGKHHLMDLDKVGIGCKFVLAKEYGKRFQFSIT